MIAELLAPLLEWTGLAIVPLLLVVFVIIYVLKG